MKTKIAIDFGCYENLSSWLLAVDNQLVNQFYSALFQLKENEEKKQAGSLILNSKSLGSFGQYMSMCRALSYSNNFELSNEKNKTYEKKANNSDFDLFKVNGSPSKKKKNNLKVWCNAKSAEFNPIIKNNSDVFRDEVLDKVISVAAETGASVNNFGALFHRKYKKNEVVSDTCFLRAPDKQNPYILVYFVMVEAWYKCERVMFVESNKGGVTLNMKQKKFNLNKNMVDRISKSQLMRVIDEMEKDGFFSF